MLPQGGNISYGQGRISYRVSDISFRPAWGSSPFRRTKKQPIFDENGLFFLRFLGFFLHFGSKNEGKQNPWRKFGANHHKNRRFWSLGGRAAKRNRAAGLESVACSAVFRMRLAQNPGFMGRPPVRTKAQNALRLFCLKERIPYLQEAVKHAMI